MNGLEASGVIELESGHQLLVFISEALSCKDYCERLCQDRQQARLVSLVVQNLVISSAYVRMHSAIQQVPSLRRWR